MPIDEAGRFEIEFRLRQKEREFQQAIVAANSVHIDALADDGVVVPGQPVKVSLIVANRGGADVNVKQVRFDGFSSDASLRAHRRDGSDRRPSRARRHRRRPGTGRVAAQERSGRALRAVVDGEARTSASPSRTGIAPAKAGRYTFDEDAPFGLPYRPTPFYVQVTMTFGADARGGFLRPAGAVSLRGRHLQRREARRAAGRAGPVGARLTASGDRAGVSATSPRAWQPGAQRSVGRDAGARRACRTPRVRFASPSSTTPVLKRTTMVKLALPAGWTSTPSEQPVAFTREDESRTVRFQVKPAPGAAAGEYKIAATASIGEHGFDRGYQVDRIPAHPAAAHLSVGRDRREDHRREDCAEPHGRLHHGRRRRGAGGDRPARRQGRDDRARGARVGRPVTLRHHRDRSPRLRAARRSAREQQPAARLRERGRHADRAVQQVRVQPGAVRPVPGQGDAPSASPTSTRRSRCSIRTIRS